mgnify:CR=1 FL=1
MSSRIELICGLVWLVWEAMTRPTKHKGDTMNWLNASDISETGSSAEAAGLGFIQKWGLIGEIVLGAWDAVDPLRCLYAADEYLGYAKRFLEAATQAAVSIADEWTDFPGFVEELVRRAFSPSQVVPNTKLGRPFAREEDIQAIARSITEQVEALGGMDRLLPKS